MATSIFATPQPSIEAMSKDQPALPAKRAFVVQVHTDARVDLGQWKGRIEHLISGEAEHFDSLEELAAFVAQILTEQQQ